MPLELKTGKRTQYNAAGPQAQLMIYTTSSATPAAHVPFGALWYPQLAAQDHGGVFVVAADPTHVTALLQRRNVLVGAASPSAIAERRLPAPLADAFECERCPRPSAVQLVHRALEHAPGEPPPCDTHSSGGSLPRGGRGT